MILQCLYSLMLLSINSCHNCNSLSIIIYNISFVYVWSVEHFINDAKCACFELSYSWFNIASMKLCFCKVDDLLDLRYQCYQQFKKIKIFQTSPFEELLSPKSFLKPTDVCLNQPWIGHKIWCTLLSGWDKRGGN